MAGREWEACRNLITVLCLCVSSTSACLWLWPDTSLLILSCGFSGKIHFSVDLSLSSCQPVGIYQQPFSSSGGKQQIQNRATYHYPWPVGCPFGQPNSGKWQDLDAGEGV